MCCTAGPGAIISCAEGAGLLVCLCLLHVWQCHVPRGDHPGSECHQSEPLRGPAAAAGGRGGELGIPLLKLVTVLAEAGLGFGPRW